VVAAADRCGGDLVAACAARDVPGLPSGAAAEAEALASALAQARGALDREGVGAACVEAAVRCGVADRLVCDRSDRAADQLDRLRRLCRAARRYERHAQHPALADFLAGAVVTLSTLHGAKGAEWDHVLITGMCEGLLPHRRAIDRGEVDEERRLAYVGITRARVELSLSWPARREGRFTSASRFLAEAGVAEQGARLAA